MKKFEYSKAYYSDTAVDKLHELEQVKQEDYELPEFSKEIPIRSRKKEKNDSITINYSWKYAESHCIKVDEITFKKGHKLKNFYKVNARDGLDSICIKHQGVRYILRKTTKEIAQALLNMGEVMKGTLEGVVGYLTSILGNVYVISKLSGKVWSFDKRISRNGVKYLDKSTMDEEGKSTLFELLVEKIANIHVKKLVMGKFSLNNILMYQDKIKFSDLRELRVSRKKSYFVQEFMNIMQYLFAAGIGRREDMYAAAATYAVINEESCNQWYQEQTGKQPRETFDVVCKIEEELSF